MKDKIILIGDSSSWVSCLVIEKIVKVAQKLDVEIVAIVDTRDSKTFRIKKYLAFLAQKVFNPFDRFFVSPGSHIFRRYSGIRKIIARDINAKEFIESMRNMNPDYAVVVGVAHIMKMDLISSFKKTLNYHNSYLPECGGLYATSWEMYHEYDRSGFTFHYIEDESIDTGRVILQCKTKNCVKKSPYENEFIKTSCALEYVEEALQLLTSKYKGKVQAGGTYYGIKEINTIRAVKSLDDIDEINRRIHCFNYVNFRSEKVTKISKEGAVQRIKYLPVFIYRFIRSLNDNF